MAADAKTRTACEAVVRLLLTFHHREKWHVSFLAEDAKTPVGRPFTVPDMETLLRIVEKLGGNPDRVRTDVYNWGRGSEWVEMSDAQHRYFGFGHDGR